MHLFFAAPGLNFKLEFYSFFFFLFLGKFIWKLTVFMKKMIDLKNIFNKECMLCWQQNLMGC